MTWLGILMASAVVVVLTLAVVRDVIGQVRDRRHLDRLANNARADDEDAWVRTGRVERRLRAAGLRTDALSFVSAVAVLLVVVMMGLQSLMTETPVAAVLGAGLVAGLVWIVLGMVGRRRARRFEAKLSDAVSLMIGALKAGENLTQSFATAAEASIGAVRKEFDEVARRLEIGMKVRRAMRPISEGYDSQGIRLFTQTVIAKAQAGGDLAPVLENVNRVLRDRLRLRWRLERSYGPARFGALLLTLAPYLLIPFFYFWQPGWIQRLFEHPLGLRLFFAAMALQVVAALWLRSLFKIEL